MLLLQRSAAGEDQFKREKRDCVLIQITSRVGHRIKFIQIGLIRQNIKLTSQS